MKFYKCPLCCNITFSSIDELKKHLVRAASPLKCPICFTQCQNIMSLVKHLDACKLVCETMSPEPFPNDLARVSQISDNEDDDDVEGYFCTVCDTKIPNLEQHIQQYHTGQEIILQDDDDDDNIGDSHSSTIVNTLGSSVDTSLTKPASVEMNGSDSLNEKNVRKKSAKDEEEEVNEAFYCTKCEKIVDSFAEHTASFHANDDVIFKDISVAELFTETKLKNGSQGYFCTSCQKPLARKRTLSKHVKLNACPQTSGSKNKRKKSSDSPSSNQQLTYGYNAANNQIHNQQSNVQSVYQMKTVKSESYSFEDLGHSIFNT